MGWRNQSHGVEYSLLGVTLPRMDEHRRTEYQTSLARYHASNGQLMAIDDVTRDEVHLIDADGARQL